MKLVAYDIADAKRLRKVAKILKQNGLRVQNSTFELKVSTAEMENIKKMIEEIIDMDEDKVFIYTISSKKKKNRRRGKRKNIWEMMF